MTTIDQARAMCGAGFDDMTDEEVLGVMTSIERKIQRPLKASEAHIFRGALTGRRTYLQKQAGVPQPQFVPEMYGTVPASREQRALDSNEQGEP